MAPQRLRLTPLQQALILSGSAVDAPWANIEQIVIEAPDLPADEERLRAALADLSARHAALRMHVVSGEDGLPEFLVPAAQQAVPPALTLLDWRAKPESLRAERLVALLAADRLQGFDLSAGPGWRVARMDAGAAGIVLLLTLHHAIVDLAAMVRIADELADLLGGRTLAPVAMPGDGLAEAMRVLELDDPAAAGAHFCTAFEGFEGATLLAPPASRCGRMALQLGELDATITAALRARASAAGVGMFAALQTAWALVLARVTGRDEASFGLTLSARARLGAGVVPVAPLIATQPQRVPMADLPDLDSLLQRVQTATRGLQAHIGAAPAQIRAWAEIPAALPLFDSVLVWSRADLAAGLNALGKGWPARRMRLLEEGDMPATLAIYGDQELWVELEHDPALIPPARAQVLLQAYLRLLAAMAASPPGATLCSLAMQSPSEQAVLLRLGEPDLALPEALPCLATRFEAQAVQTPSALAVFDPAGAAQGLSLSYAALDQRANALALRLAELAADAPEPLFAINLPRGAAFIQAELAALKCGAAFLPLDMALPEAERTLRCQEAGAIAVVGHTLPEGLALPLIAPGDECAPAGPPRPAPDAGRLAYVIHTSGSTGRPKGVMGTTGALAAHASAVIAAWGLNPADRVLHFASPGFDVALEEIWPSLLSGAAVMVRGEDQAGSIQAFLDFLRDQAVTVLNLPASFWHVLVEEMGQRRLSLPATVRLLITGSERIRPQALVAWQAIAPACRWINGYGPTETTITCTAWMPAPGAALPAGELPIGRPLAHARARVLAFDGSLAPRGAEGDLHIGGPAVTRGYLGDPATTGRSFGPDPLVPGGRLYATGDRAFWREDGQLGFVGRRDRQVKLRGYRIDLGDVERMLSLNPAVREVRVAVEGEGASAWLIAWLSGTGLHEGSQALTDLRAAAARQMPGTLLPVIMPVEAFPLRPNGKIDMAALPRPSVPAPQPGDSGAPVDLLTGAIMTCIREVLRIDFIGADADIRDYGAGSLVALRLASALEARFGRPVQTTDLYRHPTARSIAAFLETGGEETSSIVPIQTGGSQPPFFAVHVLGDKESLYRPLAAALGPDFPVYGLTMGPPKNLDDIRVETIAQTYFEDIQRAFPEGPVCLGAVSMAAYFAYDLGQRLIAAGREVRILAVLDAEGPGGRPARRGAERIFGHLAELVRVGPRHITRLLRYRRNNQRLDHELAEARPGEINGANLVLANVRAVDAYKPAPYGGAIGVFRASESFWDSRAALASSLGWQPVATGPLRRFDLPGDHLTILAEENVGVLAGCLAPVIRGGRL